MNEISEVGMSGLFFNRIFGCFPRKFMTIPEVDKFVQKKIGENLKIEYFHRDICSNRGSVFNIEKVKNADERFDEALSK